MSKEKAKAHFLGQAGHKKLNCGQAIISAFKERFALSDEEIKRFAHFGAGRAPGGYCGSLYAAQVMLEKSHPEVLKECERLFLEKAGSTKCKEIRRAGKLSCLGCVEVIAERIEKH